MTTATTTTRRARSAAGLFDELIVDSFAGGGGASIGIERAIGRAVDVAINHDEQAIAMHRVNHPHTLHLCDDVFDVDPIAATGGRPVGLAWFSPDCTHFSKARGAAPRSPRVRGLAWVVIRWAAAVRPRVIMLENVEEFTTWGPLRNGRPCRKRRGRTFRQWVGHLRNLGYDVQWRELEACDYGAPTIRKRLFLVARCDGEPIVWPEPTHGPGRRRPYRTAAECIDWSLPCPSIFERKRPLAEKTLARIAAGVKRYVIDAAEPFIVPIQHYGRGHNGHSIREPLRTITAHPKGGSFALAVPYMVPRYGERDGQAPRCRSTQDPHPTITPTGNGGQLVAAFLARHFGGMTGRDARRPLPTTTARGTQNQVVAAHLSHFYSSNTRGGNGDLGAPIKTITAGGNHAGLVAALLVKYYGRDKHGQSMREPLHTIPTKERFGLVTVHLDGEPYTIVDIGMRMLQPHELYAAQGFPPDYIHDYGIDADGRRIELTKTAQVRMCGNSVCPPVVEALVKANVKAAIPAAMRG